VHPVGGSKLIRELPQTCFVAGDQQQVIAAGGQAAGVGRTDTAGGAGDQRGLGMRRLSWSYSWL